jgi:RNA polymerase sigma-70 factor (ECF subfamily)
VEQPSGVQGLYEAAYARLVAQVQIVAGTRSDAEEAVQEAFARLLPKWRTVSTYDDPEAWVRLVAFRVVTSRWRRAQAATRGRNRLQRTTEAAAAASDDAVYLGQALADLTVDQRMVLVLHYVLDRPVEQIARDLGVAQGTVKSRLSRARKAARDLLNDQEAS